MKIIRSFSGISSLTGNAATGYPLTNLKTFDTNQIWKGLSSSETIVIDLGSAKHVEGIFLNNANFTSAVITVASDSSFSSGAVSKTVTLRQDDLGIYRAFVKMQESGSLTRRYVRIVCSSLVSGSVCTLGNVIIGAHEELKVNSCDIDIEDNFDSFTSWGGAYRERRKGQSRHTLSLSMNGTKAELRNILFNFDRAVLSLDLDDVSDAYLVGLALGRKGKIANPVDCSLTLTFNELI